MPGSANQQVVAVTADEVVVAGATEDQVVAATAGDHVVGSVLADDHVVGQRGGQINRPRTKPEDWACWIGTTNQVIIGTKRIAFIGGIVEVDELDAGPRGVAGIVAIHRDGAAIGVDDQAAIGGACIIVLGVEARQNRQEGERIDGGRDNRQPVGRSTTGRIDGLIDSVVAVTRIVDVGVVTQATIEGVGAGAADEDVVAAEAVQSVVPAKAQEQVIAGGAIKRVGTWSAGNDAQRGIAELQPLDAGERVGAVGLEAIGHDCVGYSYRAIRVGAEGIVLEIVAERGRVDVSDGISASSRDLADDLRAGRD